MRRIQRLDRVDPIRATDEEALIAVVMRERRHSGMPLSDGAYATLAAPGDPLAHAAPPRDPRRRPPPSSSVPAPDRPHSPQPGPSGTQGRRHPQGISPGPSEAQGGPRRPPPGFVDLTADADTEAEDEEMDEAPATPSPNASDDEMKTTGGGRPCLSRPQL